MLHTLAFNSNFLKKLWNFVLNECGTVMPFTESIPSTYIQILSRGLLNSSFDWPQFIPHLTIFCALFNYFLQTLDDVEFFNEHIERNLQLFFKASHNEIKPELFKTIIPQLHNEKLFFDSKFFEIINQLSWTTMYDHSNVVWH
mgnify:CR=1 FL=1